MNLQVDPCSIAARILRNNTPFEFPDIYTILVTKDPYALCLYIRV